MPPDLSEYVYETISSDCFRVFAFKPPQSDGRIRGSLMKTSFESLPSYCALSYTWALPFAATAERADSQIEIEGRPFRVHNNLLQFLHRLANEPDVQIDNIWIDAICINQKDEIEKSVQVNLMGRIYSSAQSVLIWLGPDDGHVQAASDLMDCLCRITSEQRWQIRPDTLTAENVRNLIGDYIDRTYWISLAIFFSRRWFFRAWTIQEVLLARKLLVFCGDLASTKISWEKLEIVSGYLATSVWTRAFKDTEFLRGLVIKPHLNGPCKLKAARISLHRGEDALLHGLIRSRRFECENELDKVYCLYGIAKEHSKYASLVPRPDYQMPIPEALTNAAIAMLRGSEDLLVLAYAEGQELRNHQDLPSWVPDWTFTKTIGLGITGYKRFWACGNLQRYLYVHHDHRRISIRGARFDEIVAIGESKQQVEKQKAFPRWLDIIQSLDQIYYTGESRMDVFWRTLVTDTDARSRKCPANIPTFEFSNWLRKNAIYCEQNKDINKDAADTLRKLTDLYDVGGRNSLIPSPADITSLSRLKGSTSHDDALDTGKSDVFETNFAHALCLRLFRTKLGFLGKGSLSLRLGDTIWIVPGLRVPLILRKKERKDLTNQEVLEEFEVVGGAYVHGFMHGEALERDLDFRTIGLV